jgi:FtsZ-binding cell division protein ZapB
MTPQELQTMALMRMEIKELQRQNTLLQRCIAQLSADQTAMWDLLRVVGALKKSKKSS